MQIINNTLLSEYNSLLLFHNYTVLVASFNEVKYEYNKIVSSSSGFYFVPRPIINPIGFFYYIPYEVFCIPPEYHFITSDYYCYTIDQMRKMLFINSSFNNNIGGAMGQPFTSIHNMITSII